MNKITEEHIRRKIKDVLYMVLPGYTTTVCQLTLENGFTVTGEYDCVDPHDFNRVDGEMYALKSAISKVWGLEGYLLKERLYRESLPTGDVSLTHHGDFGTFGSALRALQSGKRVARTGWNGKGLWLELQAPDSHSPMTLPYIFMSYPNDAKNTPGARVPWLASQTDMLADDWIIISQ